MNYFVHPLGCCESLNIGEGSRIWAFTHVLPGARMGRECNICDHVFIENDVVIGDRVTVKCGVQLWDGLVIENDVFIGPNATFTNDIFPRSKQYPEKFSQTRVCQGASIGANATILPGVVIGQRAMIGAGAVVARSVPANAIVVGNPARIIGYVDAPISTMAADIGGVNHSDLAVEATQVKGVTLHRLPMVHDLRGNLSSGEFDRHVPFTVKRYFLVFDVPSSKTRGEHAHKLCHQFLLCVKGSVSVVADDGYNRQEFELSQPNMAVYLPAMTWGIQYKYSSDAVLLVFASEHYDAADYVRDYDDFTRMIRDK